MARILAARAAPSHWRTRPRRMSVHLPQGARGTVVKRRWLLRLVLASSLSLVLLALFSTTGLDTLITSRFLALAAPAPGAGGRVVDRAYALEVSEWKFNPATTHYYAQVDGLTWVEAEAYAVRLGGHLVTINDQAEQDWLSATFTQESVGIGLNDLASEGTWVWTSGEPVTYTNWDPGEPNNCIECAGGPEGEDIAAMNFTSGGYPGSGPGWADLPGSNGALIEVRALPTTGWISGAVTAAGSLRQPIMVDALVQDPNGADWRIVGSATTDASGAYEIGDLPPADYRIVFRGGAEFADQYWPGQSYADSASTVHVTAGATVSELNAAMVLTGTITGQVTNGTDPIANATVKAEASTPSGWIVASTARTGSDGRYRLAGLAPGQYRISFEDPEGRLLPEVYDDASLESPTLVNVAPRANAGGIDSTMSPRPIGAASPTLAGSSLAEQGLPKIKSITSGANHACLIGEDGSLWCWGDNHYGQLGLGLALDARVTVPKRVEGIPGRVRQVVAFDVSTCALTESGGAWCWGWNDQGQLGDGTKENRFVPTPVLGLESGATALALSHSVSHMCAILTDGSAACWGDNYAGQLGDGTADERAGAVRVTATNEKLVAISTAPGWTCVVTAGGALRCWGALWEDWTGQAWDPAWARSRPAGTPPAPS